MKNLILVGFMGSGKSDAGRQAATRLGMKFVDMDKLIEQREGRKVSQIFETDGEKYFRARERTLSQEISGWQDHVVATGGGVVLNPENIRDFSRTGVVICCWVDARVAFERTKHTRHRPWWEDTADRLAQIQKLLREREPLYKAIPNQVDTTAMNLAQQTDEIVRIYKQQAG